MMSINTYEEYMAKMSNHFGNRYDLFKLLNEEFSITTASYPGSYIDITPSFFFSKTYYIDIDKKAKKFFENKEVILEYIERNKTYEKKTNLIFLPQDYRNKFDDIAESSDLLISLYAGLISKYCKDLLKKNGVLLANDSHGDASMAHLDDDFTFFGVIEYQNKKYSFKTDNLDEYFITKKNITVTEEFLEKTGKGIGYKKSANYYVFFKK